MRGIIGAKNDTEAEFKKNGGKYMILPAILEMSDGTLAACGIRLFPHSNDKFAEEGGHFDVYMYDSMQKSKKPGNFMLNLRKAATQAYAKSRARARRVPRVTLGTRGPRAVPY